MNGKDQLDEILIQACKKGASDIHLKAGIIPVIRKYGKLRSISSQAQPLTSYAIDEMAFGILDETQKELYRQNKQIDLGYGVSGLGRFRVNIFRQRGTTRLVIRAIPMDVASLDELNLPPALKEISKLERGLVLVTGTTGSGKSTTLASMIDHINRQSNKHIITIEDPIEYLIRDRKSIISQREIGTDSMTFHEALKASLRQDPDVILIGEMRDRETMEIALTAAETGHLVFSTLHTAEAKESINRILSAFPPHQHSQIRYQLASVLKAVISQRLAKLSDNRGFIPAVEILRNNPRVAEMIADPARTGELLNVIEESNSWGMQSFDQSLSDLVKKERISFDEALTISTSPEDFRLKHSGISGDRDRQKWESHEDSENSDNHASWQTIQELDLEPPTEILKNDAEHDDSIEYYDDDESSTESADITPRVIKKAAK